MDQNYKPENYNSLSPYLVVDNAAALIDSYIKIFDAKPLRRYETEDGKIMHAEVLIEDNVLMIADSNENYPAVTCLLHLYVPDVNNAFARALENGCKSISVPENKPGDPDTRGSFYDAAGNYWSVSTQKGFMEKGAQE